MDVIPLLGCLCNSRPISRMHPLINWEGCQYVYVWLERMVHHTPPNAESTRKVFKFSSLYPWHIPQVLYGQCGCYPLTGLLVQWCINLTYIIIDGLRGGSRCVWTIRVHGSSHSTQRRGWKCASFHPFCHDISCRYCLVSMNETHLLGCLYNGRPKSPMHRLINWEKCQHTSMDD